MCNDFVFCNCPLNPKEAELSNPAIQNIPADSPFNLGLAVIGGNGPNIIFNGAGSLNLNNGLYLVSYSTVAVWTTTPYGTNEAITSLLLRSTLLADSVVAVQVPPQTTDVGLVPFKLNLSKTILVRVRFNNSSLMLVNKGLSSINFENTVVTILKLS